MKRILPFILFAAILLSACGVASRSEAPVFDGGAPVELPAAQQEAYAPAPTAGVSDGLANSAPAGGSGVDAASVERIVIQNADLAIVVADVQGRMKNIQIMAEQMGGFVVSSNLYQNYTSQNIEVPEATIVIRVPAVKLDDALDQIKKDVVDIQSENRSGQDVTAQYVDLQSRLKNLEAAETQLNQIMEKATATEDVVNVFNQLVYYREQIEVVKGQIKYYDEAAALSAISVHIIAEETVKPIKIGGWQPKGVANQAIQDLIYFYQDFVDFVIRFVIYTLPVWITVGIPLYLIFIGVRALFRKFRGNKIKKEEPSQPDKTK